MFLTGPTGEHTSQYANHPDWSNSFGQTNEDPKKRKGNRNILVELRYLPFFPKSMR